MRDRGSKAKFRVLIEIAGHTIHTNAGFAQNRQMPTSNRHELVGIFVSGNFLALSSAGNLRLCYLAGPASRNKLMLTAKPALGFRAG